MLEGYVAAGFSPQDFWQLTPRLYLAHMRGARARLEREHEERAWLAWHAAYLPKLKKPVRLEDLLPNAVEPKPIGWEEQLAAWTTYARYKAH